MTTRNLRTPAFSHGSAAALPAIGSPVAAAREERFTPKTRSSGFSAWVIECCPRERGIGTEELEFLSFFETPLVRFEPPPGANAPSGQARFHNPKVPESSEKLPGGDGRRGGVRGEGERHSRQRRPA